MNQVRPIWVAQQAEIAKSSHSSTVPMVRPAMLRQSVPPERALDDRADFQPYRSSFLKLSFVSRRETKVIAAAPAIR